MIELSFDFNGHRYGVRYYASTNIISYHCDYKPIRVASFKDVLGQSKHDTSHWRKQLGLKAEPKLHYACK